MSALLPIIIFLVVIAALNTYEYGRID